MSKVQLHEIVQRVDKLPELPQVAMRLLQLLEDPDINAEKLAEVIRIDPNFTSQILRLCNSAAYGFRRTISTVKEAVAILGLKVLKSMVYTIISKYALDRPVEGYGLKEGDLWYNALTGAVYAKHIAQREKFHDPELAFTAALLRDIGKIVLGDFVGPSYAEIEKTAIKEKIDFPEAEEKVLGVNHVIIGARIAEKWNLPQYIQDVIRYHHKPIKLPTAMPEEHARLICIVHLADVYTMMIGRGGGSDGLMYSIDMDSLEKHGFDVKGDYLVHLMGELVEQNKTVKELMQSFTAE